MSDYKIESGVPVPPHGLAQRWVIIADAMKENDSVVVKNQKEANSMRQTLRAKGFCVTARKELKQAGKFRVWKLSKK